MTQLPHQSYLLILLKQVHQLGTKYSNMDLQNHPHSNHYSFLGNFYSIDIIDRENVKLAYISWAKPQRELGTSSRIKLVEVWGKWAISDPVLAKT